MAIPSLTSGQNTLNKIRQKQADLRQALIAVATKYVGIKEDGDNAGLYVQLFQKAVDGMASREPWCAGFVHYCLLENDKLNKSKHNVFKSENCVNIWRNTAGKYKSQVPTEGSIVVWKMSETSGHMGIVVSVGATKIITIEGNTGDGEKGLVVREGDGVYKRERFKNPKSDKFFLLGYINPYAA